MSEKLSPYTPMSEAKTARVDSTGATLPFHLQERVGLNTKYLTTLMQIGGIGTLKIVSDNNGETSKTSATMVGFTRNGEAYAGKAKIDSVPSSNHNLTDINSPDPKQSSWPKLNLTLNIPEMKQRILRSPNERVSDPKVWAKNIQEAIRNAIIQSGTKHLTSGLGTIEKDVLKYYVANYAIQSILFLSGTTSSLSFSLFCALFPNSMTNLLLTRTNGYEKPGEGYRVSFFSGIEIDRALALNTYGRLKPIARPLGQK